MHNPIEHPRTKYSRKVLLVRLGVLAREDPDKLSTPVVFYAGLVENVFILEQA